LGVLIGAVSVAALTALFFLAILALCGWRGLTLLELALKFLHSGVWNDEGACSAWAFFVCARKMPCANPALHGSGVDVKVLGQIPHRPETFIAHEAPFL